jgi:hypothetical protein
MSSFLVRNSVKCSGLNITEKLLESWKSGPFVADGVGAQLMLYILNLVPN